MQKINLKKIKKSSMVDHWENRKNKKNKNLEKKNVNFRKIR